LFGSFEVSGAAGRGWLGRAPHTGYQKSLPAQAILTLQGGGWGGMLG